MGKRQSLHFGLKRYPCGVRECLYMGWGMRPKAGSLSKADKLATVRGCPDSLYASSSPNHEIAKSLYYALQIH